jgi:hypothetical protein
MAASIVATPKDLDKKLQQLIFFASNHYPRIMTTAREKLFM